MPDFSDRPDALTQPDHNGYFVRPRINSLLTEALKKPVVVVCAGIGYGKTIAVSDLVRECGIPTVWIQLTEFDNVGPSFWTNYTRAIAQVNKPLAEECEELGFPDTEDKINQYVLQRDRALGSQRYIVVLDDFHLVKNATVMYFIERLIYNMLEDRTIILVCRELPHINLSGLLVRGMVANIDESKLSFTESELAQYLLHHGLSSETQHLNEIYQDTKGWAFSVNFLVRMLKNSPGYNTYVRDFMKQNIFQLMETEAWGAISEKLQRFLVRLSLLRRLSAELVSILAAGDEDLLAELSEQRVVYLRFDEYSGCYLIHYLFLEYLHSRQEILSDEEIYDTYKKAAEWYSQSGFNVDAFSYYEKIGEYETIVSIIRETPTQLLLGVAGHLKNVFDRAPEDIYSRVEFFACARVRILMLAGLWPEAVELLKYYEGKFGLLPAGDEYRERSLGSLYCIWGVLRQLMCTADDVYDFDLYFEKMSKCPMVFPAGQRRDGYPLGPWLNRAGVSRQGAPQEYNEAVTRSAGYISKGPGNWLECQDELGQGELLFYQGETTAARRLITGALGHAERDRQYVAAHLARFYLMRIAVCQGDYEKAETALKDMEAQLEEDEYYNRFSTYDIALGWYYYILRQPDRIPGWLKGKFTPFTPTNLLDNFGNQMKARYYYLAKNYDVLLSYIEDMKQRVSTLYGRVEMLAIEACARYQLKDKVRAFAALQEAYETALPNDIITPFVEMGKDMRTLTIVTMRDPECKIPVQWQKNVNQKASIYARHQTLLISEYKKANDLDTEVTLSHREMEVLHDLNVGFSRSEIAANEGLSINTVRLVIDTIYEKLKARNVADLIRIAHEKKLL